MNTAMPRRAGPRTLKPWRRDALILGSAAGLSTLLAVGLELTNAATFGATRSMDVYVLAMVWPSLISITIPGALVSVLVPRYATIKVADGVASARGYARKWIESYLIVGIVLAFSLALRANPLNAILSSQLDKAAQLDYISLVVSLSIAAAVVGTYSLTASFKNADGDVRPTAVFAPIQNVVLLVAVTAFGLAWGPMALAAGQGFLAVMALAFVAFHLTRSRAAQTDHPPPATASAAVHPRWGEVWAVALVMLGQVVYFLLTPVERFLGSTLAPGNLAAMAYALRVGGVASNLVGGVVGTILLPRFASLSAVKAHTRLRHGIEQSLVVLACLICPAIAVLGVLRYEVIRLVLERRHFTASASEATASALLGYTGFFIVIVLARPVAAALTALREYAAVLVMNVVCLTLYVPLAWAAVRKPGHLAMLTAAWSACHVMSMAFGLLILHKRVGVSLSVLSIALAKIAVVTAAVAAAVLAVRSACFGLGGSLRDLLVIVIGGLIGIAGIAGLIFLVLRETLKESTEEGVAENAV